MWAKNPKGVDGKLSQSKPFLASWDRKPGRAKLEKIVCTYYRGGCGERIEKALANCAKDEGTGQIKEAVFEETIGPLVSQVLEELFGNMLGELMLAAII
jgi:hypothetical protein